MKNKVTNFFMNIPKVIKLGILAFILYLAIDNLFPPSSDLIINILKAAIVAISVIISNYIFLEENNE